MRREPYALEMEAEDRKNKKGKGMSRAKVVRKKARNCISNVAKALPLVGPPVSYVLARRQNRRHLRRHHDTIGFQVLDPQQNEENAELEKEWNRRCNELKEEIKEKENEIKNLEEEKENLEKIYQSKFPAPKKLSKLKAVQERSDFTRAGTIELYGLIRTQLLQYVEEELKTLLTAPVVEREGRFKTVTSGDRDQYGAYGLLLNAYKLLHPSLTIDKSDKISKSILRKASSMKVAVQLEGEMKEKVAANVKTSIKLTQEMLFLIPPLVVGSEEMVLCYNEELCDTNRKTWDEEKEGDQLLWYRPVVMYGNQSHIAVKGLVGNCTVPIPEEEKEETVPLQSNPNLKVIVSSEIILHTDPSPEEALPDDQEAATGDNALKVYSDPGSPDLHNSIVPLKDSESHNEKSPLALTTGQGTEELQADLDDVEETIIN